MAGSNNEIELDMGKFRQQVEIMGAALSEDQLKLLLYRVVRSAGGKRNIKKIVTNDSDAIYEGGKQWIGEQVQNPYTNRSTLECRIPLRSKRGTVGGRFKAENGYPGWSNVGHKYRVKAHIIKGSPTLLPQRMANMRNMEPWRNTSSTKPGFPNTAFIRKENTMDSPFVSVPAIAAVQMPMNRARPQVEEHIMESLENALLERFDALWDSISRAK